MSSSFFPLLLFLPPYMGEGGRTDSQRSREPEMMSRLVGRTGVNTGLLLGEVEMRCFAV